MYLLIFEEIFYFFLYNMSMSKLILITIADSWHHFGTPIREYEKRLEKELMIIQLKPSNTGTVEAMRQKDTEHVMQELKKYTHSQVILCDIHGKNM